MKWWTGVVVLTGSLIIATATETFASPVEDAFGPNLGTLWVKASPNLVGGELAGCILEYAVLARDCVYKQGGFVHIGGSIGLMVTNRNVAVTLKVVVNDIDPVSAALRPSAPTSAYFVAGNVTTRDMLIDNTASDTPGGFFAIFKADPTLEFVFEGLTANKLTIAFGRRPGGTDVQFVVDPTVVETGDGGRRVRSPDPVLEFSACNKSLLEKSLQGLR